MKHDIGFCTKPDICRIGMPKFWLESDRPPSAPYTQVKVAYRVELLYLPARQGPKLSLIITMSISRNCPLANEAAVYLIEHGVLRKQPLDSSFSQLVIKVLQRSINAIAVQLVPAVGQHHCLHHMLASYIATTHWHQ